MTATITIMMIGAVILTWFLVAILTALVVGNLIQRRDRHRPVEEDSLPEQAPEPGRLTEQSSPRRGRR